MNDTNVEYGKTFAIVQLLFTIMFSLSPANIELGMKIILFIATLITTIFTCRYYFIATKEKRQNLKTKNKTPE